MTRMKTLEEIAVMTIIKFGLPFREFLPKKLSARIDAIEGRIRRTMTGTNYYEFYKTMNDQEFDISWKQGTWTFVQRGLYEYDEYYDQKRVHIQAGKETFLSWVWSSVFGLHFWWQGPYETSFMVTDFQLEPSARQVEFHGYYYCQRTARRITFKSTFQFSATSFYVKVRNEEQFISPWNELFVEFWESCFQKPDPTGRGQAWDNHHHNPPFIQSTRQFLFDM